MKALEELAMRWNNTNVSSACAWMKWAARLAPLAVLVFGIGCGGDTQHYRGTTPFTESWSGIWNLTGAQDTGKMDITVADDATIYGDFTDFATGETGIVKGATHPDGTTNLSFTVDTTGVIIPITLNIQLVHPAGSTAVLLGGSGIFTRPGSKGYAFTMDCGYLDAPVTSPGAYGGTWAIAGGDSGTLNWFVGETGAIGGTFTDTVKGTTGAIKGVSVFTGQFAAAFYPTGGGAPTPVQGFFSFGTTTVIVNTIPTQVVQITGVGTATPPTAAAMPFTFTALYD